MGPGIRSPIQRLVVGWSLLTCGRPTFVLSLSACRIRKFFQHGHNNQTTCGYGRKATSQQIGNTSQSPTTFAVWSQSRSKTSLKKPNIAWSDRKILPEAHSSLFVVHITVTFLHVTSSADDLLYKVRRNGSLRVSSAAAGPAPSVNNRGAARAWPALTLVEQI